MKRIVCAVLTLIFVGQLQAQQLQEFPRDKAKFQKTLEEFLTATKLDNCIAVNAEFQELVKNNAFDVQQLDEIVEVSNAMLKRKLAPNPYFVNFLTAVNAQGRNKANVAKFVEWTTLATKIVTNAPKGNNKDFSKFLDFSKAFFVQGAINATNAKTWKFYGDSYQFSVNADNVLKLSFPTGRLVGYNPKFTDSVSIETTSGDYYPATNTWEGKGGLLTWLKAGLSPSVVFANVTKPYSLNLDNMVFSIDSVEFSYKEYFKKTFFGKYTDKIGSGDTTHLTYPRFESDGEPVVIKDIAPEVDYQGGFGIRGNRVIGFGTPENKAFVTFYKNNKTQKIVTARFTEFFYTKDVDLSSTKAEVYLFNDNDTIYHPELTMSYKIPKRELKLIRNDNAISKSRFIDTYHNIEFDADAIYWNLDSPRMEVKILSGVGLVGAVYESKNFFAKWRIQQVQGVAPYEPLAVIRKLAEKQGTNTLSTYDVAKALDPSLSESAARTLLYELVQGGFITYDDLTSTITLRDKLTHFVLSNAKKSDYDNIRMKSVMKTGTDFMNTETNELELKGVEIVPISDTAKVTFYPAGGDLKLQKNRDMLFGGKIYAGRMDFFGKEKFQFKYDSFTVDLNTIDSMRINIPDGDKTDVEGNEKLITLRTNIDSIRGRMDIDLPINKSGRARLLQYPKLHSYDKSYAYYSDPLIAGGSYKRSDFYFELDPFDMDSLGHFNVPTLAFKGRLVSGGIFPNIEQELKVQEDYSLGFTATAPPAGWDLYKGNGNFKGDMKLDFRGVTGVGDIEHLTAKFSAKDIRFYLDSLLATADTFSISRSTTGPKTPEVTNAGVSVVWRTKADTMDILMKDRPFAMYQGQTELKGNLMLSSAGLRGNGTLDWKEAVISSNDFDLKTDELFADTAAMQIKSTFGDKVTFKTPNVYAHVNFKTHMADFKSNVPEMPTIFDYNQYKTNIREFNWDIDNKFLEFTVPANEAGEYFESINPLQLGLKYRSKRATYDLKTSVLTVQKIEYIPVADARVFPDKAEVVIREAAAMDQLKNASIIVDTFHVGHKLENCTLDIISKAELKGDGWYYYSCENHEKQPIYFPKIGTVKETMYTDKKEEITDYSLVATDAKITDSTLFYLYPALTFNGDATLYGRNQGINFDGFAKLQFKNPLIATSPFNLTDDIQPKRMYFHYDTIERNPETEKLGLGLYFNKSSDEAQMPYTSIFSPLKDVQDEAMFHPVGVVTQPAADQYQFADEALVNFDNQFGNLMLYDDAKGIITGEGGFTLPAQFSQMRSKAAGSFKHDMNKKQYTLNLTFGLDMKSDKNTEEKLAYLLYTETLDNPDINYGTEKFKKIYYALADQKTDAKILQEYEVNKMFQRPKDLNHFLVLSDMNFVYDSVDNTFRSFGRIGLSFAGDYEIHKKLFGYVEFGPRNSGADFFNIFLQLSTGKWVYFNFKNKTLGLVSSYEDLNYIIEMLPPDKRIVGDRKESYKYTLASTSDKENFTDLQKEKSNPPLTEANYFRKRTAKDSAEIARIKNGGVAPAPQPQVTPANGNGQAPAPAQQQPDSALAPKTNADKLKEKYQQQQPK